VPRPGFLDVRAAFTFIVRDGEAYLERSLLALLAAGSAFAEYRVFFLENDSVDGTRSILRRYIELYPRRIAGEMLSNVSWLRSYKRQYHMMLRVHKRYEFTHRYERTP